MNKETIMNTYAKEQGYESWRELVIDHVFNFDCVLTYEDLIEHQNKVTDLIQEELKKKIVSESNIEIIEHRSGYKSKAKSYSYGEYKFQVDEETILNTEILL